MHPGGPLRSRAAAVARWLRALPAPLAVALVVAFVAAPAAAASITAVKLVGGGTPVAVAPTGQLPVAQVAPSAVRVFARLDLGGGACVPIYTAPAGEAFVLEQVTVNVFDTPTSGPARNVRLATDAACNVRFGDVNPIIVGATVLPLSIPLVIPAGHRIYASSDNGILAEIYGYGYLEPKADAAGATGPVTPQPGPAPNSNQQPAVRPAHRAPRKDQA